jgi:hypothetical protein
MSNSQEHQQQEQQMGWQEMQPALMLQHQHRQERQRMM